MYFLVPPCRDLGLLPQHPAEEVRNSLQRRYRSDGSRVWLQLRWAVWHTAADPAVSSWGGKFMPRPAPLSVCLCLISPSPVSPFSQQVFLSACSLSAHPHIWILSVWQTNCFLQSLLPWKPESGIDRGPNDWFVTTNLTVVTNRSFLWLCYYLALGKRFNLISRLMDLVWSY